MKDNKSPSECVFIKDGIIVAFAHFDPKGGGIYAANNEVMPSFNWHPHEHLARLRQLNKLYYRTIKKARCIGCFWGNRCEFKDLILSENK